MTGRRDIRPPVPVDYYADRDLGDENPPVLDLMQARKTALATPPVPQADGDARPYLSEGHDATDLADPDEDDDCADCTDE